MFTLNAWFWLNVANAVLGLVVAYYFGKVVVALVQDLRRGGKKEGTVAQVEERRKAA